MIAYLLCESVDLGYHVISAYLNDTRAQEECDTLNARYRDDPESPVKVSMPKTFDIKGC